MVLITYCGFRGLSCRFHTRQFALLFFTLSIILFAIGAWIKLAIPLLMLFSTLAVLLITFSFLRLALQRKEYRRSFILFASTTLLDGFLLVLMQYIRVGNSAELPTKAHFTLLLFPVGLASITLLTAIVGFSLLQKKILIHRYGHGVLRGTMRGYWYLTAAGVTLLFGFLLFSFSIRQAGISLRQTMLDTADILAQTINPSDMQRLTGTEADLQSPAYQRLKKHLMHQRAFLPHLRFICLMQFQNNQAIILTDSEPEESEDYSPPGDIYYEASDELLKGMRGTTRFTEGLCVDRWGIWISSYSPVKDPESDETIGFMCLDMEASLWSDLVRKSGLTPLMVTVIILFLLTAIHYQLLEMAIERSRAEKAHERQVKLNRLLRQAVVRADELAFEAEAATVAKTRFLSNMTHELRTPLNGVLGISELMLDDALSLEQQIDFAQIIHQSGEKLLHIINDILDYTQIETGMISWAQNPFSLKEEIQSLISETKLRAEQNGLRFTSTVDPDISPTFLDDKRRLLQMLSHLLDNAIKFTPHGSIHFSVQRLSSDEEHAEKILFTITDTGIGIPTDRVQKMFGPFIQLDSSDTRKYGGIGLGLAICRKLCDFIGGTIRLESKLHEGTTAYLTIPIALPPKESPQ
ncbi:MAG: ATP-binding protein [Kiritimatiellae bacterium]|nr:ATP-binding protein [Kiritimatiellia bacterium]